MILVFGGAYQGKSAFVTEKFNLNESDIYNCNETIDFSYKVLNNFEKFILHLIRNNINPTNYIQANFKKFQDKIIIMQDISNGVVPIDDTMRKWREDVGRCMVVFSKNSDEVYRVFCGIDTKIK